MLLEKNATVDPCDNDSCTPLIKSCLNNHTSIAQLLIKYKADINVNMVHGGNALFFSALNGNVELLQLLLENNADCNVCIHSKKRITYTRTNHAWTTLNTIKKDLCCSILNISSLDIQEYILKKSEKSNREISVKYPNGSCSKLSFSEQGFFYKASVMYALGVVAGSSSLHIACFMGRTAVVRCLLEHKANINMTKEDGTTPLSYACEVGHNDIVRLLLDKNAYVDPRDNLGFTPLITSCVNNDTSIVQILLRHKPEVNARTFDGGNALYFSALNGNVEITQLLLENGADCNICIDSKELIIDNLIKHAWITLLVEKRRVFNTLVDNSPINVRLYVRMKSMRYFGNDSSLKCIKDKSVDYAFDVVAGSSPLHIACFMGRTDVVRCLLHHDAHINIAKEDGTTPLYYACEVGHTDIVQMLLEKNVNVDLCDNNGFTPLIKTCLKNNTSTVQLLIKHKPNINARTFDGGNALFFSAMHGNLEITNLLLENGADCNICINSKEHIIDTLTNHVWQTLEQEKQELYYTLISNSQSNVRDFVSKKSLDYVFELVADSSPLHIACFMGRLDVVRCLLEHKAININMTKEDGTTPLSYAFKVGHTDIVMMLLEKNAKIDSFDNDGFTPLIRSCFNNKNSIVQLFIKHKADINARTLDGGNALYFSALYGNLEITQLLLENGADCNICIDSKERIINTFTNHVKKSLKQVKESILCSIMLNNRSHKIDEFVFKKMADPIYRKPGLLSRDFDLKKLVDYVFELVSDSSPLHIACLMGRTNVVRCLLEHKANINMTKEDGTTQLFYACEVGHTDIVRLLLENNACVNPRDNDGFTPLIKSCLNNKTRIVQLLIKHKADIIARTLDGGNALYFSALNGNLEITQLLLENGADCNICIDSKERIINTFTIDVKKSLKQKKQDIFDIIFLYSQHDEMHVSRGLIINFQKSFLHEIIMSFHHDREKLIDYAFDVVAGSSPLHIACFRGRIDVVRCLLEHKSNINMTKEDGTTPLAYACKVGHIEIVKMLLERNPCVDIFDNDGFTPLIKACMNNNTSVVQLLMQHKPDINAKALHGLNALFFSAMNGNLEIVQLLLKSNADCNICCDSKEYIKDALTNHTNKTLKQIKQDIFDIVNNLLSIANDYLRDESFRYKAIKYNSEEYVHNDSEEAIDHAFDVVAGSSPLQIACFMGRTDVVRCLLEHKANINTKKEDGITPLSYACEFGHTDIVDILLDQNANINLCDNDGFTPLIKSCLNNNISTSQLLIQQKPDINARTVDGANALFFSALNGNLEITQILLQNNADCNICFYSKECMICTFKDHAKKSFEQKKQDIFDIFTDNSSSNVKHHVTKKSLYQFWTKSLDYVRIRKKAVDYVFDVVAGSSPLHIACFMGRTGVVRCLLENKANINMTKEDGTTPLSYACEVGHTDILEMLLEKNPYVARCDNDGFTPLIKACMNNNTSVVQLLMQHKPDINARTLHGLNALFFGAMNGNLEIVQLLLKNSADCNTCFDSKEYIKDALTIHANKTLTQIQQDIFDIVNNLLSIANDYDIDRNRLFKYGNEEYVDYDRKESEDYDRSESEDCDRKESVDYDRKESVDYDNEFLDPVFDAVTSSSPLHIACFMRKKDVVCCLLEQKANINIAKDDGTTPLFYACEVGLKDTVRLLLDKGADTQMCRLDGKSPFDIARDNRHESVVIMLRKHSEDQQTISS